MMELEHKYTIDDISEMFNVTKETIRRWCRNRKIKFIKLPGEKGGYRFSQENISDFIAKQNSEPIEEVSVAKKNKLGWDY